MDKIIIPGRCGTCKKFPGNGSKCPKDLTTGRVKVYALDYGKDHCKNYDEKED